MYWTLADCLLIENAVRGTSLEAIRDHMPWEVAALNEPMAVARHGASRRRPGPTDKVLVSAAGPVGLGATLAFKSLGVSHVVVPDLIPGRLEKSSQIGADAVVNSAGVHKEPVPVEFVNVMSDEITILGSMGYPDEIFGVTKDLVANWRNTR